MKCPHCGEGFWDDLHYSDYGIDADGQWEIGADTCPTCRRLVLRLYLNRKPTMADALGPLISAAGSPHAAALVPRHAEYPVWPRTNQSRLCPEEVPRHIRADYLEAAAVLPDSPKASAALSRRAMQAVLREAGKVKKGKLYDEIEQVIHDVPSFIADQLHDLRTIDNLAAHPQKYDQTGEIVDVEPGEAEWNLDTLEALFDFYYVQPEKAKQRKEALNKKLEAKGKDPLK